MKTTLFLLLMTNICFADSINWTDPGFASPEWQEGRITNFYKEYWDLTMMKKPTDFYIAEIKTNDTKVSISCNEFDSENCYKVHNIKVECQKGYTLQGVIPEDTVISMCEPGYFCIPQKSYKSAVLTCVPG